MEGNLNLVVPGFADNILGPDGLHYNFELQYCDATSINWSYDPVSQRVRVGGSSSVSERYIAKLILFRHVKLWILYFEDYD